MLLIDIKIILVKTVIFNLLETFKIYFKNILQKVNYKTIKPKTILTRIFAI